MIEITNINPIHKGDLMATCSVKIKPWKMTFHKVTVWQKGVNRWVTMPREKYETRDGETKYNDLIEFEDNNSKKRFSDQIVEAVNEYIEKVGDFTPEAIVKKDDPLPW